MITERTAGTAEEEIWIPDKSNAPFRISLLYLTVVLALKLQVPEATTYLEDLHNYSLNPCLLFSGLYVLLSTHLLPPCQSV